MIYTYVCDLCIQLPHSKWFLYIYTYISDLCTYICLYIHIHMYLCLQLPHSKWFVYRRFWLSPIFIYLYMFIYIHTYLICVYSFLIQSGLYFVYFDYLPYSYTYVCLYIYIHAWFVYTASSFRVICILSILMIYHVHILIYVYIYTYICNLCIQLPHSKWFAYCLFWWSPMLFPRSPPVHDPWPYFTTHLTWVGGRTGGGVSVGMRVCVRLCACVGGGWM